MSKTRLNQMVSTSQLKAEMVRLDIKKATPNYMLSTRKSDTDRLKVKEWRKTKHANTNQRKSGVAILIPDKANFITRELISDRGIV